MDDFRVLEGSFYQGIEFFFILVYFMASFMFRSSAVKRFTNRSSTANRLFRFASTYWDTIPNMCVRLLFSLFNSKVNCHVNGSGISILFQHCTIHTTGCPREIFINLDINNNDNPSRKESNQEKCLKLFKNPLCYL